MFMKFLVLYGFIICHLSCTISDSKKLNTFKTLVTDTTRGQFNDLEFGKWQSSRLNIQQINNGVDSFELRIWNFGMWARKELVILRYFDNKWVTCNYDYWENGKRVIDSLHLLCKQIDSNVAYKIQMFVTKDSILELPSQTAIPNFKDNTADGNTYFIEIATKTFYKTLGYHNPQYFNDPYNRQFLLLIHFLELYFNFFHTD